MRGGSGLGRGGGDVVDGLAQAAVLLGDFFAWPYWWVAYNVLGGAGGLYLFRWLWVNRRGSGL